MTFTTVTPRSSTASRHSARLATTRPGRPCDDYAGLGNCYLHGQARGSHTEAAKILGVPRTTLINRVNRYGLT